MENIRHEVETELKKKEEEILSLKAEISKKRKEIAKLKNIIKKIEVL